MTLGDVVNQGNKPEISLSPELERYLIAYFAEPNARLAEYLGISLAQWQRS
jgi:hypothetical protein